MTQNELAELLKISPRTVQAYEQGEIIPYKNLRGLERFLGRPAAWFLHGDEALQAPDVRHDEVMTSLRALHQKVYLLLSRL